MNNNENKMDAGLNQVQDRDADAGLNQAQDRDADAGLNQNKTGKIKRLLAIVALALIALVLLLLFYATITHNSGLIMASLFCLIVVPVVVHLIMFLAKVIEDRNPMQ
ncbi:MAG: hypothetical protein Q4E57_11235 [Eubacteriales bacterium]|nr:hypothetical protein [Eubacteriales bacterium]